MFVSYKPVVIRVVPYLLSAMLLLSTMNRRFLVLLNSCLSHTDERTNLQYTSVACSQV